MSSATTQLHNPRATWFLGAPVTKAVAVSTAIIYIIAEMNKLHRAMMLDTTKIFDHAQFYRIFVYNFTFSTMGELVMGLAALTPLMRRFEREMGSKRFGAFIVYASVISTLSELVIFNIFFDTERYSGPYPQLGAVLALYHRYTPRLHPKFFGILGYDLSEKSLTYGLCAQVVMSGGFSTFIPSLVGFVSGLLCVSLSENLLPNFVHACCNSIGSSFADEAPAIMMARTVQRGGTGNRQRRAAQRPTAAVAPPVVRRPPPPPEEAIAQLCSMGFERAAVIRALQQSDNNVEAAANRLLMG
mmetsp:Transcript_18168/g.42351  ORF Transcript_18168/g.42351 Transcript_18168/m.42351 type:complete len:300 (-) Transcript_18168:17-916(-)